MPHILKWFLMVSSNVPLTRFEKCWNCFENALPISETSSKRITVSVVLAQNIDQDHNKTTILFFVCIYLSCVWKHLPKTFYFWRLNSSWFRRRISWNVSKTAFISELWLHCREDIALPRCLCRHYTWYVFYMGQDILTCPTHLCHTSCC